MCILIIALASRFVTQNMGAKISATQHLLVLAIGPPRRALLLANGKWHAYLGTRKG